MRNYRIFTAAFVILSSGSVLMGQGEPKTATLDQVKGGPSSSMPTTEDVMRSRISKAKAYLVVKNYPAASYELENIRRETNDPTVHRVLNVLLMHSYLEQGEYKKAQKFLKELNADKAKTGDYFAVAGQVVSGAKSQLARYKALGISVSDGKLPDAATSDLNGMRETLELIVKLSKVKGKEKEVSATAAAVIEESSSARGKLARDAYDRKRWSDQVAEAREQLVNPRTKIIDAVQEPIDSPDVTLVATKIETPEKKAVEQKEEEQKKEEEKKRDSNPKIDEALVAKVVDTPEPTPEVTPKASEPENRDPVVDSESKDLKPVAESESNEPPAALLAVKKESSEKKPEVMPATNSAPEEPATRKSDSQPPKKIVGMMPTDRKVRIIRGAEKRPTDEVRLEEQPNVKSTDQVEEQEPKKAERPVSKKKKPEKKEPTKKEPEKVEQKTEREPSIDLNRDPLPMGSLIAYATRRVSPVYPRQARTMRMEGTVKVEVVVDEKGKVTKVENASGPPLLKRAARDAVRKWKFRPFVRDGQPVKATGYVSFNFNL